METKIFVIAFPTMETVAEKISSILDDAFNCKPKKTECKRTKCYDTPKRKVWEDLTPPEFKVRNEFGNAPILEWGIGGKLMITFASVQVLRLMSHVARTTTSVGSSRATTLHLTAS